MISKKNITTSKKNIILISIDCLRADHLSCMGYTKNITPNIDELAKNGIIFRNAMANGFNTLYSVPSFLTSILPPIHERISPTIAEILKEHGYKTAMFNPNPIISMKIPGDVKVKSLNLEKGFDTFDFMLPNKKKLGIVFDGIIRISLKYFRIYLNENGEAFNFIYQIYSKVLKICPYIFSSKQNIYLPTAEEINENVLKWIKNNIKNKFFLWIHYMDVHEPYLSPYYSNKKEMLYLISKHSDFPTKLTSEEIKKLHIFYDDLVKYTDNAIGSLINNLKKMECYHNSIIILTADHGEAFGEHGTLGHGNRFVDQLYEEIIHVPLILYGLGKKIENRPVQLLDLTPTICWLLNIPRPNDFEGENLFSLKQRGIISISKNFISYRKNKYKLIISKLKDKENEFYNLLEDPKEKINLYKKQTDIVQKLELELLSSLKKSKTKREKIKIEKKLKTL